MIHSLYAPDDYWIATDDEKAVICNGCGTKGLGGILVPDSLYGLNITPVCDIHDFMYAKGKTIDDKDSADRTFLNNMLRIIEQGSKWLSWPRRRRALKYYEAVRVFGGAAFWKGKD